MMAYRNDGQGNPSQFGDDLAEGFIRAAKKWDSNVPMMDHLYPIWGIPRDDDPRVHLESGYASLLGDRDMNEHCFYRMGLKKNASPSKN